MKEARASLSGFQGGASGESSKARGESSSVPKEITMAAHVLTTPVTEHTMSAGDPTVTHPSSGGTEDSMLSPSELSTRRCQGRASTLGRATKHASPH